MPLSQLPESAESAASPSARAGLPALLKLATHAECPDSGCEGPALRVSSQSDPLSPAGPACSATSAQPASRNAGAMRSCSLIGIRSSPAITRHRFTTAWLRAMISLASLADTRK